VIVRARLEGNLERVLVRPGQAVRAGQLLAVYEPVLQQSQRSAAEADRQAARTDLSTAQWNLDQSRELFRAGAIAEREVRVAEQAVAAARARLSATEARIRQTALDLADTRVEAPIAGVVESRAVEGGERVSAGPSCSPWCAATCWSSRARCPSASPPTCARGRRCASTWPAARSPAAWRA
jgi:RND family efflux transporter MFP subunit